MNVNLYIYVDEVSNEILPLTCDTTNFTSDSTSITADETQQGQFVTNNVAKKIDLFDDEKISVTSSIQNINDISKVFTDYSQSFTIPASKNNNKLFRHWYENALDNGFNQLIRYNGFIEVDSRVFRSGRWQLESATIKQNKIENYKITFYGNLLSLTDKFGEDKLSDIQELNAYTIDYSGQNVAGLIESTADDNLMFPLISSKRVWQYGGGGADDISNSATPIIYNELAPALKVARIFDAIESKYNVTFNGNFLSQSRFDNAFLWLKNKEIFSQLSAPVKVDITGIIDEDFGGGYIGVDLTTDEYTSFLSNYDFNPLTQIYLTLTTSCNWIVNFYKNNQLYFTMNGTGTNIDLNVIAEVNETGGGIGPYYMTLQTSVPVTYSGNLYSGYDVWDGFSNYETHFTNYSVAGTTGGQLDLTKYVPDMKIADFVSGILKMFNLTAFSENEKDYTFEQLENWYYQGQIKNFTEYTITDLDFERIKAYKKINFQFEKSESFMNRAFYDNAGREYANLTYNFNIDGSDFTIKLPFESLLFNQFTGNNLQVAYSVDKKFAPYITKPVILYKLKNETLDHSFYFNTGTTTTTIGKYNVFGQDVLYNNEVHSLNFGQEISSFYLNSIPNSLFNDYYYAYLINLYSLKSRMVKVKMRLPYNELLDLKLNDRIVIRDKRYIINQFTTDLTTFEVSMELIQDFRSINFPNFTGRTIDNQAQTIRVDYVANEILDWVVGSDPNNMIESITSFEGYVEIVTKPNTTGIDLFYSVTNRNLDLIVITQNG